ncbi:MAG: hypothetical protein HOI41_00175 [Acidimicrobiaceae bacterium]|nr:hypothetical protein [Acidimicrobiaceae bacterium]
MKLYPRIIAKRKKEKRYVKDSFDLFASRSVDIKSCQSVCLTLGPYRNLTTLTGAVLSLHSDCQVLNHGGSRIFGRRQVDFLSSFNPERFDRFVQYALHISTGGQRGSRGGSITYSHAFDAQHAGADALAASSKQSPRGDARCLFWKEPLRTSNLIRDKNVDVSHILDVDGRLRFLLPIRNPLDCAVSNIMTGHTKLFRGLSQDAAVEDVLDAVLDEILWFFELAEGHPERFFHYFEHGISRSMLIELAAFLEIEPTEEWLRGALDAMQVNEGYTHPPKLSKYFCAAVESRFKQYPDLTASLLCFLDA